MGYRTERVIQTGFRRLWRAEPVVVPIEYEMTHASQTTSNVTRTPGASPPLPGEPAEKGSGLARAVQEARANVRSAMTDTLDTLRFMAPSR
jgi:hypothetical protein